MLSQQMSLWYYSVSDNQMIPETSEQLAVLNEAFAVICRGRNALLTWNIPYLKI
jgi:hypothetical protein